MNKFHTKDFLFVDLVTLIVKDLNESLRFYQNVLGFIIKDEDINSYTLGSKNHNLIKIVEDKDALPKAKTTGLYHLALLLPNRHYIGQLMKHFMALNQKIIGGSDHGVSEALYLSDPDGNGIEIYSDRDSFEWEYNDGGEVIMYTEMMDYENMLLNAYDNPWEEIPEDTIMGHVHFHVNDLTKGVEFFIDTLGFQKTLNYGGSAIFLSDKKYHHHVGMNIWNGITANNRPVNMVGLESYHLTVPKNYLNDLINRINEKGYEIKNDDNGRYIVDINDVKVYF